MKITFLLGFHPNQRMNKRMRLLMKCGHDVSVIYWKKNENDNAYGSDIATTQSYCIDIQFNEKLIYERAMALLKFTAEAEKLLNGIHPDALYVQNIDLFLFAASYKRRNKDLRLVYEVSDINDILIQLQRSPIKKIIQRVLKKREELSCRKLDLFCYTSPAFLDERYGAFIPENKQMYLPNIPDLSYFAEYCQHPFSDFTVGYIGTIRYEDELRNMLEAAKLAGVRSVVAGGVSSGGSRGSRIDIEAMKTDYPDTEFIGAFDYPSQIAGIYSQINVSYAVYPNHLRNTQVALPNKLYEGIRCEIPIIVAPNTYLADTVLNMGVGVTSGSVKQTAAHLQKMKADEKYYNFFQQKCHENHDFIDADQINRSFCEWFSENGR